MKKWSRWLLPRICNVMHGQQNTLTGWRF